MSDEIDDLVDAGRYPNRSAFVRAGARLLLKCERENVWPAFGAQREEPVAATDGSPGSLQEVAARNADSTAATPAADGGMATAEETKAGQAAAIDVSVGGETVRGAADDTAERDAAESENAYEFIADSPAVSEADIVTKLSSVMQEATAGEWAVIAP